MGSWNATCGVTQLPIRERTPVVLFPLVVKQQDFLARDTLSGSGSSENDLIAQPLSLPLYGTYDGYGGAETDPASPGHRYLLEQLTKLASAGRLMHAGNGNPKPVKKVSDSTLDRFRAGELLVKVPNERKEWLAELRKTIDAQADKSGFSHYEEQLKVDPATMPDHVLLGLGYMLVPRALFDELCRIQGSKPAYGYFDEAKHTMVTFEGTRAQELTAFCSVTKDQRSTLAKFFAEMTEVFRGEKSGLDAQVLTTGMLLNARRQVGTLNAHRLYWGDAADPAVHDSTLNDDQAARELWVAFHLFCEAMGELRRQWTPQAGAGSSQELYESAALYAAANNFVAQALAEANSD